MATQNLLNIVQNILASMSSDEVNSIGDTVESLQVAQIVQNKYYDIVARGDLTLDEQLYQLVPPDTLTIPVVMQLPQGCSRIDWLQYFDTNPLDNTQIDQFGAYSHDLNLDLISRVIWTTTSASSVAIPPTGSGVVTFVVTSSTLPITIGQLAQANSGSNAIIGTVAQYVGTTLVLNVTSVIGTGTFNSWIITSVNVPNAPPGYKYVTIVPNDYFLDITNRFDITQPFVFQYTFNQGGNNFHFRARNDVQASICTVLSNRYVIFDALDASQDSTLQASKTLCYGQLVPPFVLEDNFVPQLDDHQFPLLLNEAKSLAFYELKQMPHTKADQEIQRQWAVTQARKSKANKPSYYDQLANYGRVPRTGGYGGYPLWRFMRNSGNFGSSI
jgi:hypothetical protein